ncbi:hypothetical protein J7K74_00465 [Candidatus Woesearchaeota archaeon]|nr:hypothetical protein [Candidatus Woesearchaeota archaeon]
MVMILLILVMKSYAIDIDIISPEKDITNETQIKLISTIVSTSNLVDCNYSVDQETHSINCSTTSYVLNTTLNLSQEGRHFIQICARDESNQTSCEQKEIEIDYTAPSIVLVNPSNGEEINEKEVKLEVVTDEESKCRYSDNPENFESMDAMDTLNNLLHKTLLVGLEEGEYNYYVKCRDRAGNIVSITTNFIVNLPPEVSVYIEEETPKKDDTYILKAGTYTIVLEASEPIKTASLYYQFNDESAKHVINLISTEDKKKWKGYLIISKGTQNKAGSFYYSVKDYDDLSSSGSETMFLVDTIPPDMVDSFGYNYENNTVVLKWHHPYQDEVEKYRLYKKDKPGVGYTDLLSEIESDTYEDVNIEEGETYYYRVSAVDAAGNEGTLSQELKVVIPVKEEEKPRLDPEVEKRLNDTKRDINLLLLDIENTITELDSKDGEEADMISILGLTASLRGIKNKVNSLKNQLGAIDASMDKSEAMNRLSNIEKSIETYKAAIPKTLEIISKKSWIQGGVEQEPLIVEKYMLVKKKTKEGYNDYLSRVKQLEDEVIINGEAWKVRVIYLDGKEKEYIVIEKNVDYREFTGKEDIVEYIPKTLSTSSDGIIFKTTPKIIEKDPIVYWDYGSITGRITYYLEGSDLGEVLNTKTLVMPVIEEDNSITGAAVTENTGIIRTIWDNIIMITGIIAILGLVAYYYFYIRPSSPLIDQQQGEITTMIEPSNSQDLSLKIKTYNNLLRHYNTVRKTSDPLLRNNALLLANRLKALYTEIMLELKLREAEMAARNKDIATLSYLLDDIEELYDRAKSIGASQELIYRANKELHTFKRFIVENDPFTTRMGGYKNGV